MRCAYQIMRPASKQYIINYIYMLLLQSNFHQKPHIIPYIIPCLAMSLKSFCYSDLSNSDKTKLFSLQPVLKNLHLLQFSPKLQNKFAFLPTYDLNLGPVGPFFLHTLFPCWNSLKFVSPFPCPYSAPFLPFWCINNNLFSQYFSLFHVFISFHCYHTPRLTGTFSMLSSFWKYFVPLKAHQLLIGIFYIGLI